LTAQVGYPEIVNLLLDFPTMQHGYFAFVFSSVAHAPNICFYFWLSIKQIALWDRCN